MGFKDHLEKKYEKSEVGCDVFERLEFEDYELSIQFSVDEEDPDLESCDSWDVAVVKDDNILTPYDNGGEFLTSFKHHWELLSEFALDLTTDEVEEIYNFFHKEFNKISRWESTLGEIEF